MAFLIFLKAMQRKEQTVPYLLSDTPRMMASAVMWPSQGNFIKRLNQWSWLILGLHLTTPEAQWTPFLCELPVKAFDGTKKKHKQATSRLMGAPFPPSWQCRQRTACLWAMASSPGKVLLFLIFFVKKSVFLHRCASD